MSGEFIMEKKNIKIISKSESNVCGLCGKKVALNFNYSYVFSKDMHEACIECLGVVMGLTKAEKEILAGYNTINSTKNKTDTIMWSKDSPEYKILLECVELEEQDKIFHSKGEFRKTDVFSKFLSSIDKNDNFFNSKKNEMLSLVLFFNENKELILKARELALEEINKDSGPSFFVNLYSISRFRGLSDKQKACIIRESGSAEFNKFDLMRMLLSVGLKELGIPENSVTKLWFDIMSTVCGLKIERMSAKQEAYVDKMLVKYENKIKDYFNKKGIFIKGYNTMIKYN